jgi:hypothetical protein
MTLLLNDDEWFVKTMQDSLTLVANLKKTVTTLLPYNKLKLTESMLN